MNIKEYTNELISDYVEVTGKPISMISVEEYILFREKASRDIVFSAESKREGEKIFPKNSCDNIPKKDMSNHEYEDNHTHNHTDKYKYNHIDKPTYNQEDKKTNDKVVNISKKPAADKTTTRSKKLEILRGISG